MYITDFKGLNEYEDDERVSSYLSFKRKENHKHIPGKDPKHKSDEIRIFSDVDFNEFNNLQLNYQLKQEKRIKQELLKESEKREKDNFIITKKAKKLLPSQEDQCITNNQSYMKIETQAPQKDYTITTHAITNTNTEVTTNKAKSDKNSKC